MRPRLNVIVIIGVAAWLGVPGAQAVDKPVEELPRDVAHLAFIWTEPIKSVATQVRRFDPVSGLWFGLLEGTVKTVERTAQFLFSDDTPSRVPREPGKRFRYTF
ncbi:MAG: hypothetical protein Q8R78_00245 [Candidatus Omnitrophota bacterium]|nr:hypothetical protein [Candidatus Omnitrophota bacterium]